MPPFDLAVAQTSDSYNSRGLKHCSAGAYTETIGHLIVIDTSSPSLIVAARLMVA